MPPPLPIPRYTKLVTSEIGKAEQILKLVQTPEELLEETVSSIRKAGVSVDLQKILAPRAPSRRAPAAGSARGLGPAGRAWPT
jgi:hypothetical protein